MSPRKRRARRVGCTIAPTSDFDRLRLRFRLPVLAPDGQPLLDIKGRPVERRHSEDTGITNTPENVRLLRPKAELIGAEIRAGVFDYERWFPKPERPPSPAREAAVAQETIRHRYAVWIAEKTKGTLGARPRYRQSLIRNYECDFRNYILPVLGAVELNAFLEEQRAVRELQKLQAFMRGKELSEKTIKNSLDGSLRALLRDSIGERGVGAFRKLDWGDTSPEAEPDPHTAEERDRILDYLLSKEWALPDFREGGRIERRRHFPHYAYALTLYSTGMRPGEASCLRQKHLFLAHGHLIVRGSRHKGHEYHLPKTARARRTVRLTEENVEVLRSLMPLHPRPDDYVFHALDGRPIDQERFYELFCNAQRALSIDVRDLYTTKDTYASLALTGDPENGILPVDKQWLLDQMGISERTFDRHYGRFIHSRDRDRYELSKIERSRKGPRRAQYRKGPNRAQGQGRSGEIGPSLDPAVEEEGK